ncbi:MAG: hypothetical protein GX947_02600 [Tissierellia bacterium]|nr:hypothetical protein [Tissierellia bacterium]
MFVLIIVLLIAEHKNLKIFALITPAIISMILFGAIFIKDYDTNSINEIEIGLSILGIAVTVWVGLNIYNLVEKREFDMLKIEYRNEIDSLRKDHEDKILNLQNESKSVFKKLYFSLYEAAYDDYNSTGRFPEDILEGCKIVDKYDKYIKFEDKIPFHNTLIIFDFISNLISGFGEYLTELQTQSEMYVRGETGEVLHCVNKLLSFIIEYVPKLIKAHGTMDRQLIMIISISSNLNENNSLINSMPKSPDVIKLRKLVAELELLVSKILG